MNTFLLFALFTSVLNARKDLFSVKTSLGVINGDRTRLVFQGVSYTVDRYRGIPYAKPPVGTLRYKKPEPVEAFTKPFDALTFGAICPQFDMLTKGPKKFPQSEDCLFLNIYVPQQDPDQTTGHAVMVFFHGGGFMIGNGNIFQGDVLASVGNVIVVTVNYRLGLFGFLDMDEDRALGNFGLWDQRQSLVWVNENVKAFGGDKDRVTIFGESAGSISVMLQMMYPPNKGLFQAAIAESGAPTMPLMLQKNSIIPAKYFASNLGCDVDDLDEVFRCVHNISGNQVTQIISDVVLIQGLQNQWKFTCVASVDGEFVKKRSHELYEASKNEIVEEIEFARSIRLINGVNVADGAMFLPMLGKPDELDDIVVPRQTMNFIIARLILAVFGFGVPKAVSELVSSEYTDWEKNPDDAERLRHEFIRMQSDVFFNVPSIEFSRVHANGTHVEGYMYNFRAVVGVSFLGRPRWLQKSNHGDELGPVFGYQYDFKLLFNKTDFPLSDWEYDLSTRMITYWSNFAKSGDPNVPYSPLITWPRYSMDKQDYIIFDEIDSTGQYLNANAYNLWKVVLPAVINEYKVSGDNNRQCD